MQPVCPLGYTPFDTDTPSNTAASYPAGTAARRPAAPTHPHSCPRGRASSGGCAGSGSEFEVWGTRLSCSLQHRPEIADRFSTRHGFDARRSSPSSPCCCSAARAYASPTTHWGYQTPQSSSCESITTSSPCGVACGMTSHTGAPGVRHKTLKHHISCPLQPAEQRVQLRRGPSKQL